MVKYELKMSEFLDLTELWSCWCSSGVLHGGDADAADDPTGDAVRFQVRGFCPGIGGCVQEMRAAGRRQPFRPVVHAVTEGVLARPSHRPALPLQKERRSRPPPQAALAR